MFKLALRNVFRNKKVFIVITVVFLFFSMTLVLIKGLANSAPYLMEKMVRGTMGDIHISVDNSNFLNTREVIKKLNEIKHIKKVIPYNSIKAMISNNRNTDTIQILSSNFNLEPYLKNWIVMDTGRMIDPDSTDEIVVYDPLRDWFKLKTGDYVTVAAYTHSKIINSMQFKIVGFTNLAFASAYISPTAMKLLLDGNVTNAVKVFAEHGANLYTLKNKLIGIYKNKDVKISTFSEIMEKKNAGQFFSLFTGISLLVFIIIFIANGILIAIISYISLENRIKEIGTYLAMGMKKLKLVLIIEAEYMFMILGGTILGIVLSIGVSKFLQAHRIIVSLQGYFAARLLPVIRINDLVLVSVFMILNVFLWVLVPLLKLNSFKPIELIHRV